MQDYKQNVFKGENYEYQCPRLETEYAAFVKEKKSKDQNHQNDLRDHDAAKGEFVQKQELKKQSTGIN